VEVPFPLLVREWEIVLLDISPKDFVEFKAGSVIL